MLNEVTRLCKGDFSGINKEFKVFQGDRFSPPFVLKTFKTKKEADDFVEATQKESSKYDEYTAFWVEEMIDLRKENQDLKNRSCSTCKYGRSFHFDKDIECMKLYDATQGLCFEKDFYCKNWEQK